MGIEEVKNEKYWDGIAQCYQEGLIKNVGVSNYGVTILEKAHAALSARGVPIASNQINYSLLYRLNGAQATVDKCKELGIQPIGRGGAGISISSVGIFKQSPPFGCIKKGNAALQISLASTSA